MNKKKKKMREKWRNNWTCKWICGGIVSNVPENWRIKKVKKKYEHKKITKSLNNFLNSPYSLYIRILDIRRAYHAGSGMFERDDRPSKWTNNAGEKPIQSLSPLANFFFFFYGFLFIHSSWLTWIFFYFHLLCG